MWCDQCKRFVRAIVVDHDGESFSCQCSIDSQHTIRALPPKVNIMDSDIPWVKVESSWISDAYFHEGSQRFYVRLIAGGGYCFHNVSADVAADFFTAPSHGQYFNAVLKAAHHYERIF